MQMRNKANDNGKSTDPIYGKVMAKTGNMVSGGAALLVRAEAVGGPSNLVAIGVMAALNASNQAVVNDRRKKIRAVR